MSNNPEPTSIPQTDTLRERAEKTTHGFTDLSKMADELISGHPPDQVKQIAYNLYTQPTPQPRMVAVLIYGYLAAGGDRDVLATLHESVSADVDWRVQEMLARAFDQVCRIRGYEKAVPLIESWLGDTRPNVRRAVSEGLRIWTSRPYFKQHPEHAIGLLSTLRADESDYVRRSAGNALRDISRKHADLVRADLATWDQADARIAQTYELAAQFLSQS